MGVAAEFNIETADIIHCFQGFQYRGKIDRAGAKPQVLMDASAHIFDMNRVDAVVPFQQILRNRTGFEAMDVANVDCQTEPWTVDER